MRQIINPFQDLRPRWKKPECFSRYELPTPIKKWLLFPGSFTKKIRNVVNREAIDIKILREDLELAKKKSLDGALSKCKYIYTREIQIYLSDKLIMFARSIMPKDTAACYKREFRGLGKRALGQMLFSSVIFSRGNFEIAKILPKDAEYDQAISPFEHPAYLWGRRSMFSLNNDKLLLTEIFSPYLMQLIVENETSIN